MLPSVITESIETTRIQYIKSLFLEMYWTSRTPIHAIQTIIKNLHDHGNMTQGELSEQWALAFSSSDLVPFLPDLENIPSFMDWTYVYRFISVLKPFQLYDLIKK